MVKGIRKSIMILGTIGIMVIGSIALGDGEEDRFEGIDTFGENITAPANGINTIGTDEVGENEGYTILDTIQKAINWILGMLSFIALILCIWGGFQMLTAAGDDSKVKTGTKVLKHAAIGLAIIGLAWLIVSFVFRIMNKVTG